jgi:hypothetical protein
MQATRVLERLSNFSIGTRLALVTAGYLAALVLAVVAVAAHSLLTDSTDPQASGGMSAFGDAVLFVFVFGLAALLPTAAALLFLRRAQGFWTFLSVGALLVAATAVVALVLYSVGKQAAAPDGSALEWWAGLSVLRLLLTPVLSAAFLLCLLLAPDQRSRRKLFVAMAAEGSAGAIVILYWIARFLTSSANP